LAEFSIIRDINNPNSPNNIALFVAVIGSDRSSNIYKPMFFTLMYNDNSINIIMKVIGSETIRSYLPKDLGYITQSVEKIGEILSNCRSDMSVKNGVI